MVEDLAEVDVEVDHLVVEEGEMVGVAADEEDLLVAGMYHIMIWCVCDTKTMNNRNVLDMF